MKKGIALILALFLALSTCFGALADTRYTINVSLGDELGIPGYVCDLLNYVQIIATAGDGVLNIGFYLSGSEITSIALKSDENGLFIQNDILSEQPVYISFADLMTLFYGTDVATSSVVFNPTEVFSSVLADESLMSFIVNLSTKLIQEEGSYQFENCDPATDKITISLADSDFLDLLNSTLVCDMVNSLYQISGADYSAEMENLRKGIEDGSINISLECSAYANQDELVSSTMTEAIISEGSESTANFNMRRLTTENEVAYPFELHLVNAQSGNSDITGTYCIYNTEDLLNHAFTSDIVIDSTTITMKGTAIKNATTFNANTEAFYEDVSLAQFCYDSQTLEDGSSNILSLLFNETQITLDCSYQKNNGLSINQLALYLRPNAVAIISPAASDCPVFAVIVEKDENAAEITDPFEGVTSDTCIQPLKMSNDELSALTDEIDTRSNTKLLDCYSLIPTSVLEAMMK